MELCYAPQWICRLQFRIAGQSVKPLPIPKEETRQEIAALVTHLHDATELKDTALAHKLHDELGALMGAAAMDLDAVR
jgi:hypothetical protein